MTSKANFVNILPVTSLRYRLTNEEPKLIFFVPKRGGLCKNAAQGVA